MVYQLFSIRFYFIINLKKKIHNNFHFEINLVVLITLLHTSKPNYPSYIWQKYCKKMNIILPFLIFLSRANLIKLNLI